MKNNVLKALLFFRGFSDADLSSFANRIIAALTDNENFTNLGTLLTDLTTAHEEFSQLLTQAQGGSRMQIASKNVSRKGLLTVLRQLAYEVNYVANGDMIILLSSGFAITGEPKKPASPAAHAVLKAA